ncbi:hypothetical protein [Rhodococcoides corynebacterioides]|uniref:DUF4913 domain-containing protein n=1 Tax=Rhodococcoides corynebacterioides TaxID=53972 RepID=A0ABS7P5I1_9NOCA|nr:hypothetical protein [Rhodococcus corynebacterioides]MBY6367580.1 hypothetical protein [Rhodococcus corynebacterioides]MBY6407826.1 hypothetical protein [Rhodococcus corynebacterioides]
MPALPPNDPSGQPPDSASARYAWRSLDRHDAARLWDDLVDWVWWLRDRYELTETVAPCWYRHGPVVEEFTALLAWWRTAQGEAPRDHDDASRALADWHTDGLWPLIDRLPRLADFERCRADGCAHTSGFLHAPEGTAESMEPLDLASAVSVDSDYAGDYTGDDVADADVVAVLGENLMLSAVVSGEATALDTGLRHGRYRMGGRLWSWSPILGGYIPSEDSVSRN